MACGCDDEKSNGDKIYEVLKMFDTKDIFTAIDKLKTEEIEESSDDPVKFTPGTTYKINEHACGNGWDTKLGKPFKINLDITNKGKCTITVKLKNSNGQEVASITLPENNSGTVGRDDVESIRWDCGTASQNGGKCKFTMKLAIS